jgi:hypothetical protein
VEGEAPFGHARRLAHDAARGCGVGPRPAGRARSPAVLSRSGRRAGRRGCFWFLSPRRKAEARTVLDHPKVAVASGAAHPGDGPGGAVWLPVGSIGAGRHLIDIAAGTAALSAAAGLRPAPSGVHVASSAALSPQVRVDGAQPGCRHPQAPRGARARAPPSPAAGAAGRGPRGPRRAAWAGCPVEASPSCAPSPAATPPAVVDGSQDAQRHRAVANFGDHLSRTSVIADTMAVRALAWPRDR